MMKVLMGAADGASGFHAPESKQSLELVAVSPTTINRPLYWVTWPLEKEMGYRQINSILKARAFAKSKRTLRSEAPILTQPGPEPGRVWPWTT